MNKFSKEISYYIISIVLCSVFLFWIMDLWSADLTIPFTYGGDALLESALIKGLIDNGWVLHNSFTGMPFGTFFYDYPLNSNLDFIIMKIIALFYPNWAATMNIYYILTFPLTVVTSLFVFRKLNISPLPAIAGSLLFTFVPYHFLRGEPHLTLSAYYIIPLIVLVIFWIFEDQFLLSSFQEIREFSVSRLWNYKTIVSILICLGAGSVFIYYPFFACFFFVIAGFCAAIFHKKWHPFLNAVILVAIIVICVAMWNLPTIVYQHDYGKNIGVASRSPQESEIYGLKIAQLLVPIPGNRIPLFSYIGQEYLKTTPIPSEGAMAVLGVVGSIGFIILILWIFFHSFSKFSIFNDELSKKINQLSILNLSAVLLATVGGFGTLLAYLIFPDIRAYNRISIFIAFFSILVIVLLLDYGIQKYSISKTKKWIMLGCIVAILLFGIYDQTSENFIPNYNGTKLAFMNDDQFIKNIEMTFPNDTMVFQLPYVPFPENPPVNNMADYDLFRAYLHSNNIHWSYGTMKGRYGDLWQQDITQKSTNEMIKSIAFAGFNGIYIDSYGYPDNGAQLIENISTILGTTPIFSEDHRLYFFDMTGYNLKLKSQYPSDEWSKKSDQILHPLLIQWTDGFSILEGTPRSNWRWSSSEGVATITNPTNTSKIVLINTTFFTGYPEMSEMKIESSDFSDIIDINNSGYYYQKEITIPPGSYTIKFSCDAKRVDAPSDPRVLVFRMTNFQMTEQE